MGISFVVICSAVSTLLILSAANHQRVHDWRRCRKCSRWFDRHRTITQKPPWIARFAIHGDGVCAECIENQQDPRQASPSRSLGA